VQRVGPSSAMPFSGGGCEPGILTSGSSFTGRGDHAWAVPPSHRSNASIRKNESLFFIKSSPRIVLLIIIIILVKKFFYSISKIIVSVIFTI
jgi:hypothetical protein